MNRKLILIMKTPHPNNVLQSHVHQSCAVMDSLIICELVLVHESTWWPSSTSSTYTGLVILDIGCFFNSDNRAPWELINCCNSEKKSPGHSTRLALIAVFAETTRLRSNQHLKALWRSSIVAYLKICGAKAVAEWAGGDATEGGREAELRKNNKCDVHYRMELRLL